MKNQKTSNTFLPLFFIFLVGTTGFQACEEAPEKLAEEMISFDQVFVPIFYQTWEQNPVQLPQRLQSLTTRWNHLKKVCNRQLQVLENGEYSVAMIDQWLGEAVYALSVYDWQAGMTKLDHVRYEMMQIRECNQISYYLDKVWDFQMAFELVREASNDPMLCLLSWSEFRILVENLDAGWKRLSQEKNDYAPFVLTADKKRVLGEQQQVIGSELARLQAIMDCADREEIASHVSRLEPFVFQFIRLFGEEESTRVEDALPFP